MVASDQASEAIPEVSVAFERSGSPEYYSSLAAGRTCELHPGDWAAEEDWYCPWSCSHSRTVGVVVAVEFAAVAVDRSVPEWTHMRIGNSCSVGRSAETAGTDYVAFVAWAMECAVEAVLYT